MPDPSLQMCSLILFSRSPWHSQLFSGQTTSTHSTKSSPGSLKSPAVAFHQLPYHPSPSTPNFPPNGCSGSWSALASSSSPCSSHFLYTSPTHNTQNVTSDLFPALTRCPIPDLLHPSPALPCGPSTTVFPFLCF